MVKIIIAVIVIVAAVIVGAVLFGKGGLGFGGGKGDGEGDGDAVAAVANISEKEEEKPETEEINSVELRISGNEYIYNNDKYNLDEIQALVEKIKELDDISVKLIDDDASEKAYQAIEKALKENSIRIVKE